MVQSRACLQKVARSHVCVELYDERKENTGSALWRMRAALRHRNRVRGISFQGRGGSDYFRKLIEATNYHFPALKSLFLCFQDGHGPEIPATCLRGPDRSDLPLQRLELKGGSITSSISELLSSMTALTDLTLNFVGSDSKDLDSPQASSFFACLQRMQRLRNLDLTTPFGIQGFLSPPRRSPDPEDTTATVPELTRFYYTIPALTRS